MIVGVAVLIFAGIVASVFIIPRQVFMSKPANTDAIGAKTLAIVEPDNGRTVATVTAEVADTEATRQRGLGGRAYLPEGRGMWFVFDTEARWGFWMKDTLIPLDILWATGDGTIITIAHNVQPQSYLQNPPQTFYPTAPARYALEMPAGWAVARGVVEGDKIVVQ